MNILLFLMITICILGIKSAIQEKNRYNQRKAYELVAKSKNKSTIYKILKRNLSNEDLQRLFVCPAEWIDKMQESSIEVTEREEV